MIAHTRSLSGLKKAAILLVLLGEDAAASIYKNLSDQQLQTVTQEIADMERVPPDVALQVLEEYHRLTLTQEYLAEGGRSYAASVLVKAFGEEGAKNLLEQVVRAQELSASQLDSLQKADPQQLARFLESEHPQTIALILAHMDARQGAAMLMKLPETVRAEAVKRLAQLRHFSPDVAQKVSTVLHKRLQSLGELSRRTYAGLKNVAEMLNRIEPTVSKAILDSVEQDSPRLALNIRNLMFTFEDFITVQEAGVRELMSALDKKTLALALKGASENLRSHFYKCLSSRAVEMLKEDMDVLGPVRGRDVSKAQQDAVALARKLESEGKIVLKMETEDEYVL